MEDTLVSQEKYDVIMMSFPGRETGMPGMGGQLWGYRSMTS